MSGFSLIPKNDVYFTDFDEAAALASESIAIFATAVSQSPLPKSLGPDVLALEEKTAVITDRVLDRLDNSFITPIEREDIYRLITEIDGIADDMEGITGRMDVFGITEPTPELSAIAVVLSEMGTHVRTCIQALRTMDPKAVRDETRLVAALEEKVDDLYREALRSLFARRPEAWDLVRWKEIYDAVENVADDLLRIARTIGHILVRHS